MGLVLLTRPYSPPGNKEGALRSKRYALKLRKRIFSNELNIMGNNEEDRENANSVGNILRSESLVALELNYSSPDKLDSNSKGSLRTILSKENNIYFLDVRSYPKEKRHAEEFLCDIAEYAQQFKENLYTCIAGKKRPCMGCSGRMESVGISNYGKFPGFFWTHTIKTQSKEVALKVVEQLISKPSHVSVCEDKGNRSIKYTC